MKNKESKIQFPVDLHFVLKVERPKGDSVNGHLL